MFITEDSARQRLASPDNLANRFNIRESYARFRSGKAGAAAEGEEIREQTAESGSFFALPTGLDRESPSVSIQHESIPRAGRRGPWLPTQERTEIAIAARTSGLGGGPKETQQEIAERHGISRQAVAQINAGFGLRDEAAVEQALEAARNKALDRLMSSLGLLTDDKLSAMGAKDISIVASNMAKVVEKTMPDANRQANINLVIYSPELRNEKAFEVVEI